MFSSGHVISVAFLDIIGVVVNVWFLYTVKARRYPFNAIDILQALKTVFVILALVSSVWLDLITCSEYDNEFVVLVCVGFKVAVENILFHSVCFTFLSVAFVRLKVCKCRGHAAVLITTKYALKALLLILIPLIMFTTATISLVTIYCSYTASDPLITNVTFGFKQTQHKNGSINYLIISDYSKLIYQLCHTITLNIFPLAISGIIYVNIIGIVRKTTHISAGYISQRNKNPTKLITLSIVILLTCTGILWGVYAITKIVSVYNEINQAIFIYLKLAILIIHPFGEGLLQPSTRKLGIRIRRSLSKQSNKQVHPNTPTSTTAKHVFMVSYLPSLIKEQETCRVNKLSKTHHFDTSSENRIDLTKVAQRDHKENMFGSSPSDLMKKTSQIDLEAREEPSCVALSKRRNDLEERLQTGLQHINEEKFPNTPCRRLSKCLRLSTTEFFSNAFIRENQRNMNSTENITYSKTYPMLDTNVHSQGLAYAQNGHVDSVPISNNPSSKLWKRLFTTARIARLFSNNKVNNQSNISENMTTLEHSNVSEATEIHEQPKLSILDSVNELSVSTGRLIQQHNLCDRVNDLQKRLREGKCWCTKLETRERRKTVSSISNMALDNNPHSKQTFINFPMSISHDAKLLLKNVKEVKDKLPIPYRKTSDFHMCVNSVSRGCECAVSSSATKEECINQLLQWKDYF